MPKINKDYQSIFSMGKDLVDTFKPYKGIYQAEEDFLQPLRGLGNLAKGLVSLGIIPVVFLANSIKCMVYCGSYNNFNRAMQRNVNLSLSRGIAGLGSVVRGLTQLITSPLTYFIKMPLRGLLTAIKGVTRVEQNSSIQRLVVSGDKALKEGQVLDLFIKRQQLHQKFQKAKLKGQPSLNSDAKEKEGYEKATFNSGNDFYSQYFSLFQTKKSEARQKVDSAHEAVNPPKMG